ncbi:uncharacterized protein ppp1r18 [Clarias gariepinus]
MSASMLPEWKQLLLERKRREEEEREKRARKEEERLACMPAWKRGIIQRRREKQEAGGEKIREAAGREFEPETVSVEPIWKNSLACSQNGFVKRKQRKEIEKESNYEKMGGEEKEKHDKREDNIWKWRDRGIQMERTQERYIIDKTKEKDSDSEKGIKVRERDKAICPPISGIHINKAENIIIIENRKKQREKAKRDGEGENEYGLKQLMKMDLKRFLADGENMAEICASEMLIINPSIKEEKLKEVRKQGNEDKNKLALSGTEQIGDKIECTRVSELISKFGKNCKLSCRSKSSDCFIPMEKFKEVKKKERKKKDRKDECKTEGSVNAFGGMAKRSFSFSEQVYKEGRVLERSYSDCRKRLRKKREEERKHSGNKGVNETDRNLEICTFKWEMNRFNELNKQKGIIINNNKSDGTEIKMEEIPRDKNDKKQQTESIKTVDPVVNFPDGEMESQSNKEERGMSMTCNETVHHRGEQLVPHSVFYGCSEQSFSKSDRNERRGVERKLSWKAERSLTRVESLRERILQKERGGTGGGDERAREAEMESRQEVASPQSLSQLDVTREVSKAELPVCVPPSLSAEQEFSVLTKRHDGVIEAATREKEREEDLLGEDYIAPSQSSSSSSSPSPPLGQTQPAMSRIYNLKPVTPRVGVCITERNLDVQTHSGGMIKIRSGGKFPPGPLKITKEISSLRSVQHQVEQLHLNEQEVQKQNDEEASQKTSFQDQNIDMQKSQPHTISKPSSEPRVQTQLPTTNSTNAQIEPTRRTTPLFTIRSATGGPGKRGATITITPRKSGPTGTPSSTVTTPKVSTSSVTTPKAPRNAPEQRKNRYPTAEEIQVIGGYQNLERSCLVKNRGSPKMMRVCFDDSQLECVCTYPSEESVVGEEGFSNDGRSTEEKKEENDEEEEDEDGLIGAGRGINRVLRVDESCRR